MTHEIISIYRIFIQHKLNLYCVNIYYLFAFTIAQKLSHRELDSAYPIGVPLVVFIISPGNLSSVF